MAVLRVAVQKDHEITFARGQVVKLESVDVRESIIDSVWALALMQLVIAKMRIAIQVNGLHVGLLIEAPLIVAETSLWIVPVIKRSPISRS